VTELINTKSDSTMKTQRLVESLSVDLVDNQILLSESAQNTTSDFRDSVTSAVKHVLHHTASPEISFIEEEFQELLIRFSLQQPPLPPQLLPEDIDAFFQFYEILQLVAKAASSSLYPTAKSHVDLVERIIKDKLGVARMSDCTLKQQKQLQLLIEYHMVSYHAAPKLPYLVPDPNPWKSCPFFSELPILVSDPDSWIQVPISYDNDEDVPPLIPDPLGWTSTSPSLFDELPPLVVDDEFYYDSEESYDGESEDEIWLEDILEPYDPNISFKGILTFFANIDPSALNSEGQDIYDNTITVIEKLYNLTLLIETHERIEKEKNVKNEKMQEFLKQTKVPNILEIIGNNEMPTHRKLDETISPIMVFDPGGPERMLYQFGSA